MDAIEPTGAEAQAQASKGARTRRPKGAKPAEAVKRSLNLRIDEDVYEKLTIHALRKRTTISALVEALAREHCREYHLTRTPSAKAEGQGAA